MSQAKARVNRIKDCYAKATKQILSFWSEPLSFAAVVAKKLGLIYAISPSFGI
jgi:hypothetical protein